MKKDTQKKIFAMFVMFMFLGSGFAYAILWVIPGEEESRYIFTRPLSNSEESQFLRQNIVVMRFYYREDSELSEDVLSTSLEIISEFNGKLIIELIDIDKYPDAGDYIVGRSDYISTKPLPAILLRGSTETLLQGNQTKQDLLNAVCGLYFEPVEECQ